MTKHMLTTALAAAMTLGFGATALAAPAPTSMQLQLRQSILPLDMAASNQRVVTTKFGRNDLLVKATSSRADVVNRLQRAYRASGTLSNGYTVAGYAHLVATDSWTFTLVKNGVRTVVEVSGDDAAMLRFWGTSRTNTARKPMQQGRRFKRR